MRNQNRYIIIINSTDVIHLVFNFYMLFKFDYVELKDKIDFIDIR